MKYSINPVPVYYNQFRCIEVAIAGNHSFTFIMDAPEPVKKQTFDFILNHLTDNGITFNYVDIDKAEIVIEFNMPYYLDMLKKFKGETIADIMKRISDSKKVELKNYNLSDSCHALLKTGIQRLNLSIFQVQSVFNVAGTIAILSGSTELKPEHIAEALQYQKSLSE